MILLLLKERYAGNVKNYDRKSNGSVVHFFFACSGEMCIYIKCVQSIHRLPILSSIRDLKCQKNMEQVGNYKEQM